MKKQKIKEKQTKTYEYVNKLKEVKDENRKKIF